MSSINNNPPTSFTSSSSSTTSSTTPTTRPVFDSNYLKSTYKFHQKALQRLSEVLFDDAKYLPQLMRDTDPIARLDFVDRNDPSLPDPTPRLRTPQSKQDDTMTLLWYLTENRSPMPTFQNKVHATCQICKTTKVVDREWRICPMSHEVDIWRQWLLSLVVQMFPYSPSEWTEEWVGFLQQAVAGVASFVDASTGEFTGGSHHECIPKPIPGVDDIVTLMRKIHEWTTVPYTPRRSRGKAYDGNEEKADDGNEKEAEEEDEEDDSPTLELQHYDAYLAHLRVQASEAPTIDDCASRAYEHAIVMRRIPEYRNAMKSHHVSHSTSSPPTPQSQLLQMTSRQLIGQVSRSLLREWFVKHIGLTADGSDGYRLPQSARNFWFASPIVSTQDVVEELQRRVRLDRQLKHEEQHRSTVRLVPYDDSPTPSSCASPPAHAPSQSCCAPRKPVRTRPRTRHIPEDTPPQTPDTPLVTESTAKTLSLDHLATIASKTAQMRKMSKTTSSRKRGRPKGSIPHRANQTNSARRVKPRVEHGYYLRSSVKGDRK